MKALTRLTPTKPWFAETKRQKRKRLAAWPVQDPPSYSQQRPTNSKFHQDLNDHAGPGRRVIRNVERILKGKSPIEPPALRGRR